MNSLRVSLQRCCTVSKYPEGLFRVREDRNWVKNILPKSSNLSMEFGGSFFKPIPGIPRKGKRERWTCHFIGCPMKVQMGSKILQVLGGISISGVAQNLGNLELRKSVTRLVKGEPVPNKILFTNVACTFSFIQLQSCSDLLNPPGVPYWNWPLCHLTPYGYPLDDFGLKNCPPRDRGHCYGYCVLFLRGLLGLPWGWDCFWTRSLKAVYYRVKASSQASNAVVRS